MNSTALLVLLAAAGLAQGRTDESSRARLYEVSDTAALQLRNRTGEDADAAASRSTSLSPRPCRSSCFFLTFVSNFWLIFGKL